MELFWIKELIGESHKISLSGKHVGADLNKTTLFFEDNCFVSDEKCAWFYGLLLRKI